MVNRTRINDGKIESPEVSTDKADILETEIDKISGGVADQPITNLSGGGLQHDGNGNLQVDSSVFTGSISGLSNPLTGDLDGAGYSINNLFGLDVEFLNNTRYVSEGDSIQTAINDVESFDGTVILNDSTFNQSFTVKEGVTIKGRSSNSFVNVQNTPITLKANTKLENLQVNGDKNNPTSNLINITGDQCRIIDCVITQNNNNSAIKSEGNINMILFNRIKRGVTLTSSSFENRVIGNSMFGSPPITDSGTSNTVSFN